MIPNLTVKFSNDRKKYLPWFRPDPEDFTLSDGAYSLLKLIKVRNIKTFLLKNVLSSKVPGEENDEIDDNQSSRIKNNQVLFDNLP